MFGSYSFSFYTTLTFGHYPSIAGIMCMLDGFSSACGKRAFCREASVLLITCTANHETLPYQILQFYNLP